ncbi:hypothetical protein WN55_08630 [Dufourea novaeangliae]|uniref:Uncharacterized protein n=1 Tax=Dufourea novaeangliae TaxID=178035 RepID=A0A154P4K1_DUFNO|nr:hypothetical protein WN55_08630 [Dufourea novaeangliae]
MELMFDLQLGDTLVSSAAANFGEVGGPGQVKSIHTTSMWCPLGPLVASAAKGANGVCGVLGAPGAGVGVVVERATPMTSSDDCEGRLVSSQATGSLLATGERVGCNINKNMDCTTKKSLVTAPGVLGAPGAGAGVVVKQATPASLSDDCGARLVDHQASGALTATGEGRGSNTPSEAVPDPSGPARPMTGVSKAYHRLPTLAAFPKYLGVRKGKRIWERKRKENRKGKLEKSATAIGTAEKSHKQRKLRGRRRTETNENQNSGDALKDALEISEGLVTKCATSRQEIENNNVTELKRKEKFLEAKYALACVVLQPPHYLLCPMRCHCMG